MQRLSTLDFPGVLSAVLFTQGCNFHCPYCHNPQLIPKRTGAPLLEPQEILNFLRKRAGILDGVVISGGEPTLHPGLPQLCRELKQLGYKVKLDSNGSSPDGIAQLLEEDLIDYIALDLKSLPEKYSLFTPAPDGKTAFLHSLALLQHSGHPHELRSTCVSPFIHPDDVPALAKVIGPRTPWLLQKANLTDAMLRQGLSAISPAVMADMVSQAAALGIQASIRK